MGLRCRPWLQPSRRRQSIAWRAPRCSGSVGQFPQGLYNAIRNVSEIAVMHVQQHISRIPPHVSSEVGVVCCVFQRAKIDNFNESCLVASFQQLPGRLVTITVVEPRYTAWQDLGSCIIISFHMLHVMEAMLSLAGSAAGCAMRLSQTLPSRHCLAARDGRQAEPMRVNSQRAVPRL